MKRTLSITFLALGMGLSMASAQDSTKTMACDTANASKYIRWVTIEAGLANVDNTVLKQFYYSAPNDLNQQYGMGTLGMYSQRKRWITGASLSGGMTPTIVVRNYGANYGFNFTDSYNVSSYFGNFMIHLGYNLFQNDRFRVYPILGIGAGRVGLKLELADNISNSQLLTMRTTELNLYKYMADFDVAIAFDVMFKGPKMNGSKENGVLLGIKGGYTQGVGVGNWMYNSGRLSENPSYNPGFMYVKLSLGLYRKGKSMMGCGSNGCCSK